MAQQHSCVGETNFGVALLLVMPPFGAPPLWRWGGGTLRSRACCYPGPPILGGLVAQSSFFGVICSKWLPGLLS